MATGVDAAGNDLAITVLLDELAVAYIIFIIAFETFAFLVFLDGGAIALACLEGALELRTVGIAGHTLTVDLAILELSLEHVACLRRQLTLAIGKVSLPETHVLVAVLPHHRTLAMLVAFEELAGVFIAIGILRDSCARALAVDIVAFVDVAILELIDAPAILHIVLPLTDIHIAGGILESTLALTDVVHPLSLIR